MKSKRYTPKELSRMSLKSLEQVGKPLELTFTKNHTKAERVRRILSAYSSQDVAAQATAGEGEASQGPPLSEQTSPPSGQPTTHERKPRFEALCEDNNAEYFSGANSAAAAADRGGAREGAGRPVGMTNELSVYNRLPQMPHPAIQHFLEAAFKTWATRCHCPEVALTKEQAFELALPYTQAAYLAGIVDYIPAWAMVGIELVWTTWNMVSVKAALARDAVKRKDVESKEVESDQ